ncbi:MAG TPA: cbb3-type cytochrome c oxidase subunit II [Bryobacteraceae bacterium]
MLAKADNSFSFAIVAALGLFFIGGILTTVVPPLVDKSWSRPAPGLKPYTELQLKGRAIYVREGCWYCHTQQTRTLVADTKRSGWRGVDSPVSTPDEFVYDNPHMFGTKRTGPDLSRVGGKYDTQWHRTHFRNPRDLVPGSVMPPFPWIVNNEQEFTSLVAYIQTLGRSKDWRPDHDYEK